jgi:hypothetical protein
MEIGDGAPRDFRCLPSRSHRKDARVVLQIDPLPENRLVRHSDELLRRERNQFAGRVPPAGTMAPWEMV